MSEFLSVLLDSSQERLSRDALSILVSGRDWDPTYWEDIWVDPVTNTCMLCPAPLYPDWVSSNSGIFAKWTKSTYSSLTDSGNWLSHGADQGGAFIQYNGSGGNTAGLTGIGPSVGVNQPMVVEYFPQRGTNGKVEALSFGWSNTGDGTLGPSIRVYSNGDMDVWLDNALVGTYSGGGNSPDYFSQALPVGTTLAGGAQSGQAYGYNRIMLIPCRDRELLVVSSGGASFCHIFQNLPEGVAGQTITPAAAFWFYFPAPVFAEVRIAPLQYAASGFVCGTPTNWRFAPPSGSPTFDVFEALSDASDQVTPSVITPATNPYSLANPVQIKLALTAAAAPNWTPFLYGCRGYYDPATATTAASNLELLPYVQAFHLNVSDTIGGTRASLILNRPSAIESAGGAAITTMCHRALSLSDEVGMLLNGVAEPPHWSDSYGFSPTAYDANQDIQLEIRDLWKLCEEYVFSDPIPLDGMKLSDAYRLVASMIGIPSSQVYVSSSADSFTLPFTPVSGGDWGFLCDVGDRGATILDRLHQTYASTWFHGMRPNGTNPPVLSLIDPTDSSGPPSTPAVTLYPSVAAAEAAGKTWRQVYRTYRTQILEPEANDISVVGRDPRGGKPIVAHKADAASAAVDTAVGSRPANWLGFPRKYSWVDPAITTMAAAQYALGLLYDRLTRVRELVEFECEYLPGVWRGDLVELFRPDASVVTVRIKTFSGSFEHVGTFGGLEAPDAVWRPCRYIGEVGAAVSPLDVQGTTLSAIAAAWHTLRTLSKTMVKDHGEIFGRRPTLNQQEF